MDHFSICIFISSTNLSTKHEAIYRYKSIINDEKIEAFLQNLYQYDWNIIEIHQDTNKAFDNFIVIYSVQFMALFFFEKNKNKK